MIAGFNLTAERRNTEKSFALYAPAPRRLVEILPSALERVFRAATLRLWVKQNKLTTNKQILKSRFQAIALL